jgi:TM2 domain-containing membrane protein YozV
MRALHVTGGRGAARYCVIAGNANARHGQVGAQFWHAEAMTNPWQFGDSETNPARPPYPGYPLPYPPPAGQYPRPYLDPMAPYGRHPRTGEPLSDKSKVVAGLLQLIGVIGLLGIGRMYLGYVGLGIAQLIIGLLGGLVVGAVTCGIGLLIPVVWAIIDAVLILTDKVRDPAGRPLRDGA